MDNDDVSGWKNEQRCSPSWVERVNDGWLDGLSPAEGQKEQKNICEQASVVNSVNCTFISFFLRLNWKRRREKKELAHRPTRSSVSTIVHRRRKVINHDTRENASRLISVQSIARCKKKRQARSCLDVLQTRERLVILRSPYATKNN